MLTRQAILEPPEPNDVANFCDGIQVRVSPAPGIEWNRPRKTRAYAMPWWMPSWWAPIPPAVLAMGLWLSLMIQGQ